MESSPLDEEDESPDFNLDEWIAKKHDNYEETIIKKILKHMGAERRVKEIAARCHEVTGKNSLKWEIFEEEYPFFPVRLIPRSVPYVHKITVVDLYKRFTSTPIWKAFDDGYSELGLSPTTHCVGLVFNYPGIGTMVLHNYHAVNRTSSSTIVLREVMLSRNAEQGEYFVIETLGSLLDEISKH